MLFSLCTANPRPCTSTHHPGQKTGLPDATYTTIENLLWTDATTHCGLIGAYDGTERTVVAFDPGLMLVTRYDADAAIRLSG